MSALGITLVLLSALCHAGWNLLPKSKSDPVSFLYRALRYTTFCYLPVFIFLQFKITYSTVYLLCVLASGTCAGFYFFSLAKAYSHGRISVAYPIARSFPILVVTWAGLFLQEVPSGLGLTGIILIVTGCFLLPLKRFGTGEGGFQWRDYFNKSILWALGAAFFTSLYSLIDKLAATHAPAAGLTDTLMRGVNYVYIQNACSWLIMAGLLKAANVAPAPVNRNRALAAGLIFLVSYTLIVIALAFDPVAYVVSLRQFSIVIGSILSMVLVEKEVSIPRVGGVLVIFAGVVLVGTQ